jgi:hypothetical protein
MDSGQGRPERTFNKEMSLDRVEFLRTLPGALGIERLPGTGSPLRIESGGGSVEVSFQSLPPRRLGALQLPVLRVRLVLTGFPPEDADQVIGRFERAFQRGGG